MLIWLPFACGVAWVLGDFCCAGFIGRLLVVCRCVVDWFTGLGLTLVAVWRVDLYGYFDVRLLLACGVVYGLI